MLLNNKIGVLLLNLGTPDNCNVIAVGRYLNQFLQDPRVIELPFILRWLLVKCIIVPFRTYKSAAAYSKIWQTTGSPLLNNSMQMKNKLAQKLGANYIVALGMRYGNPSIESALQELQQADVSKLLILPLFPQYSSAATGSALQKVLEIVSKYKVIPDIEIKQSFFQEQVFIQALSASVKPYLQDNFDYILLSYHGLPERQIAKLSNYNCYREQCQQTSHLLAQDLALPASKWGFSFQSRLGKLPWIKPYTDEMLVNLRQKNIQKLIILCPSFVADCLETLEEIGIRAREQWLNLGGESLQLIPCLNDQELWIDALANMLIGQKSKGVH